MIKKDWYSRTSNSTGIKVVAPNSVDGKIEVWYFEDEAMANHFAKLHSENIGQTVLIMKEIGRWKPISPVEYIAAAPE